MRKLYDLIRAEDTGERREPTLSCLNFSIKPEITEIRAPRWARVYTLGFSLRQIAVIANDDPKALTYVIDNVKKSMCYKFASPVLEKLRELEMVLFELGLYKEEIQEKIEDLRKELIP